MGGETLWRAKSGKLKQSGFRGSETLWRNESGQLKPSGFGSDESRNLHNPQIRSETNKFRQGFSKAGREAEEAYLDSPEGKAHAETMRELDERNREKINQLVSALPQAIQSGEAGVVSWIGRLSEIDAEGLPREDRNTIVMALKSAGYSRDARVGDPEVTTNPKIFADWLVGQIISIFESGGRILGNVKDLAAEYNELKGSQSNSTDGKQWTTSLGDGNGRQVGK